ncbi:MAG: mannose-1-phosphate guanylyltransferase [Candidatus Dormibacteria bacterium]
MSLTIGCILAGGAGTRLWPLSTSDRPKHLLDLHEGRTLLRATWDRVSPLCDRVLLVCPANQVDRIRLELPEAGPADLVVEPEARGTAGAIALGGAAALAIDPEAVLVTLPADHHVDDVSHWQADLRAAIAAARETGEMVTVGYRPDYPSTGLGYIECGDLVGTGPALRVIRQVEKPDLETAEGFVAGGRHLWNSSYFTFPLPALRAEFERWAPEYLSAASTALGNGAAPDPTPFLALRVDTIDYAVMEKTDRLLVVPSDLPFHDIGSWTDLHFVLPKDGRDNWIRGEVVALDTHGSVIMSGGRRVAVVGLQDMVVVDTPDALLVCPRSRAQDVKKLVEQLRQVGWEDLL